MYNLLVAFISGYTGQKSHRHILRPEELVDTNEEDPIVALEWDPLSTDYLILVNANNGIRLIDSESLSVITAFQLPSAATTVHTLAWVPSAPGMFITGGKSTIKSSQPTWNCYYRSGEYAFLQAQYPEQITVFSLFSIKDFPYTYAEGATVAYI